jgi:hypothetical protein
MDSEIKQSRQQKITTVMLGRVDGFDRDEAECQGYEGSVVFAVFHMILGSVLCVT